jgi:hypothetical protein
MIARKTSRNAAAEGRRSCRARHDPSSLPGFVFSVVLTPAQHGLRDA